MPVDGDASDGAWAEAGRYATADAGFAHGLVVLAMGRAYWLREDAAGFRLLVPVESAEAVRAQLELYDRESAGWPPVAVSAWRRGDGAPTRWLEALFVALLWAWGAIAGFAAQQRWPEATEALAMDARRVFAEGEWWRVFTALFLHADAGHLISNLGGGAFLFAVVFSMWGWMRGAALLAVSAAAANLAIGAAYYPAEYRSLGASTALFAALGLLTGRALRRAISGAAGAAEADGKRTRIWRAAWVPLGAGATMLMLFGAGSGEVRVDVPAHAAGFCAGLVAGFVFTPMRGGQAV